MPRSVFSNTHQGIPRPPSRMAVRAMQERQEYPAVSLICGELAGESIEDLHERLRALARDARRRLVAEYGGNKVVIDAVDAIEQLITHVAPSGHNGLGVFVSPDVARWYPITEPVEDRVVIDDTFATRDLVHAQLRSTETWVLHLATASRLFAGSGRRFSEVRGDGLPFVETERAGSAQRQERRDPTNDRDQELARNMRDLDQVLGPVLAEDPRPLVLIGSERRLVAFSTATRHDRSIAHRISWGGRSLSAGELDAQVGAAIDEIIDKRQGEAMAAIGASIKAGRLTSGLENCWSVAVRGLVELVVVERGYSEAARIDPSSGSATITGDREATDVVDDLVDDLIEQVLEFGGTAAFVDDGQLSEHRRIVVCGRA